VSVYVAKNSLVAISTSGFIFFGSMFAYQSSNFSEQTGRKQIISNYEDRVRSVSLLLPISAHGATAIRSAGAGVAAARGQLRK
jgi:hypothetical protein